MTPQPGAGPEIARQPHQTSTARSPGPPPLGKRPEHRLSSRDAAEREIPLGVAGAQVVGADAEEPFQIVIPDILEVPARPRVARHARFPSRVMPRPVAIVENHVDRPGIRHVGERQAFGGEPHACAARIFESSSIGAHAVVVTDAGIDLERKGTAGRRCLEPHHARRSLLDKLGESDGGATIGPLRGWEAEHRRLLVGLAAAAEHDG